MATSDFFTGSILDGNYTLRVSWSAAQNVANNTSKITADIYLVQASGWPLNIASRTDNKITINGKDYTWTSPKINKSSGTTHLATVVSDNIAHNNDGTKSVSVSATFYIRFTRSSTGVYYEKITATATLNLDTIPRATTPTLSASSVYMGNTVTINLPRAVSSFTHDLAYQFAGGSWGAIATGVATSTTWKVPDLSSKLANASSGVVTIRCITKNGSTTIGTTTVNLTVKVPESLSDYPTITAVTVEELSTEVGKDFGALVQGKSKIKVTITAAGAKGSTIESISTTFQGVTYKGSTWESGVLNAAGDAVMQITVYDSRGRGVQTTKTITVHTYTKPQITDFEVYRSIDPIEWEEDSDGEWAVVSYSYSVASLGGANTCTAVVQYKETTADEDEWVDLHTGTDLTVEGASFCEFVQFSTDDQFDFRLVVRDHFGDNTESIAPAMLPSGDVILDILADGSGIGIGTTATLSGVCDIAWKTRLRGGTMYVLIPEGANIDELRTPGRYVGDNLMATQYKGSVPFTGGTFDLDVIAAGPEGQVKQVATRCDKYEVRTRTRFYYGGGWGPWIQESTFSNNVLWNGATQTGIGGRWMASDSSQDIDLSSTPISAQPNGIVLVFSYYNGTKAENTAIQEFYIHKQSVALPSDTYGTWPTRVFPLFSIGMDLFAVKTLYITNTKIAGHANNGTTITGSNGVKYENGKFVLRYVLSF